MYITEQIYDVLSGYDSRLDKAPLEIYKKQSLPLDDPKTHVKIALTSADLLVGCFK